MTEVDRPHCHYISDVSSQMLDDQLAFRIVDAMLDDSLNEALNAVASVGGDAYTIVRGNGYTSLVLQAWQCDWEVGRSATHSKGTTQPQEISASDRPNCEFIETVGEASNLGFTKKRNSRNARRDAIDKVQALGGNSYFVVREFWDGSAASIIVEAWRCN